MKYTCILIAQVSLSFETFVALRPSLAPFTVCEFDRNGDGSLAFTPVNCSSLMTNMHELVWDNPIPSEEAKKLIGCTLACWTRKTLPSNFLLYKSWESFVFLDNSLRNLVFAKHFKLFVLYFLLIVLKIHIFQTFRLADLFVEWIGNAIFGEIKDDSAWMVLPAITAEPFDGELELDEDDQDDKEWTPKVYLRSSMSRMLQCLLLDESFYVVAHYLAERLDQLLSQFNGIYCGEFLRPLVSHMAMLSFIFDSAAEFFTFDTQLVAITQQHLGNAFEKLTKLWKFEIVRAQKHHFYRLFTHPIIKFQPILITFSTKFVQSVCVGLSWRSEFPPNFWSVLFFCPHNDTKPNFLSKLVNFSNLLSQVSFTTLRKRQGRP